MANKQRLIDVNKVINAMQKCIDESPYEKDSLASFAFELIITALKLEPTVDAVPVVHGRWLAVHDGWGCCSNCSRMDEVHEKATHCRFCGAKMDGGNEDG